MKKTNLTFALFLLSSFIFAQIPTGNLNVFSENGQRFFMILNGELQNKTAQTNVRIEGLNQPYYQVQIKFEDPKLAGIAKKTVVLADSQGVFEDVTYRIRVTSEGKAKMNLFSSAPISAGLIPANDVYVVPGNPSPTPPIVNNGGLSIGGINVNINSQNNQNNQVQQVPPRMQNRGCVGLLEMSPRDFDNGILALNKENFLEDRKRVMFQIISSNCLSTNQISVFMQRYSFDDDRLAIAKFALDYCVDPKNYYQLNSLLRLYKDDLINYVQSKRL